MGSVRASTEPIRLVLALLVGVLGGCGDPAAPPLVETLEVLTLSDTASAAATTELRVRVLDVGGAPISGSPVNFVPLNGGGTSAAATQESAGDGTASYSWSVGTEAGVQQLRIETTGPSETINMTVVPGPATTMEIVSGDGQSGAATQEVPQDLRVRVTDQHGNHVLGVPVGWTVTSGGGSTSPDTTTTTGVGEAFTRLTLGVSIGDNTVLAAAPGVDSVTFTATTSSGPPSGIQRVSGDGQTATAGSAVALDPTVRVTDGNGLPVPGVTVTFSVTSGGGSATGSTPVTDLTGTASVGSWIMGTTAGGNTLSASVDGTAAVSFSATGIPGPASTMVRSAGEGQNALAGNPVAVKPQVFVSDQYGNAVSGVSVSFSVVSGGGTATGTNATSDANGRASVGSWTLGATPGTNTLRATGSGVGAVTFSATGTESVSQFDITLEVVGTMSPSAQAEVEAAFSRWERVIIGDLADATINGSCGGGKDYNGSVDDVRIFVEITPIDGPGGVLGSAGPCIIRSGGGLPILGAIRLDSADVVNLQSNGLFDEVILHEVGHVLGIGSLWDLQSLIVGEGTSDPYFVGAIAAREYNDLGGTPTDSIPVENTGGPGTADAHWRENTLDNELMTGFINGGRPNPLSSITIGSLEDMGYVVDFSEAEGYSLPGPVLARSGPAAPLIHLRETPLTVPIRVAR